MSDEQTISAMLDLAEKAETYVEAVKVVAEKRTKESVGESATPLIELLAAAQRVQDTNQQLSQQVRYIARIDDLSEMLGLSERPDN